MSNDNPILFPYRYIKKSPREKFSNKKKSIVFSKSFKLYKEYYEKKDYLTSYFIINSILEDRINVMWFVRTWYSECIQSGLNKWEISRKPHLKEIENMSMITKVRVIYESDDIDELLKEKLIGKLNIDTNVYSGGYFQDVRNNMIHNTIWLFENINLEKICRDVNRWVRLIDSKRNKQKKKLKK